MNSNYTAPIRLEFLLNPPHHEIVVIEVKIGLKNVKELLLNIDSGSTENNFLYKRGEGGFTGTISIGFSGGEEPK